MSGHTPGPWFRDGKTIYALMHAGWRKGVELFKNRFYASVQRDAECSEEEAEANARLIAAAPELLEACKMALITFPCGREYDEARDIIRSAIAKAEGKT